MADPAQYNQDSMPMQDILAEIRQMVSSEAQSRYDKERKQAKTELLVLRPEARVDLLLQEATPDIVVEPEEKKIENPPPKPSEFKAELQAAIGVSDPNELEALIRKVFREELTVWGDS